MLMKRLKGRLGVPTCMNGTAPITEGCRQEELSFGFINIQETVNITKWSEMIYFTLLSCEETSTTASVSQWTLFWGLTSS